MASARLPTALTANFDKLIDSDDFPAARALIQPLLSSGDAEALFLSSTISLSGEDQDGFEIRSLMDLRRAAAKGYAPAVYRLGCYYRFGDFVQRDDGVAAGYFREAADAGLPAAQYEYGLCLLRGKGVASDQEAALRLVRMAAFGGDELALHFLLNESSDTG
ncbi:hypothetical protein [Stenotrophomonas sp. SY1]|uniref:tetratricopeptide repeat protein n=1 Tax=Stenotrophomonas sp. SY1 TaxID=477235 RepID=UPI001E53F459|nr:hypothetical protein [Stenotrophomonas sp. SY1]MCD9087745.1 hypothetical protein [Stenotrophomonas sp. SY1]